MAIIPWKVWRAAKPLADLVAQFNGPDDAEITVTAGELRALAKSLQGWRPEP